MNAQPKKRILLILSILAAIFTSSTAFAYNYNGVVESGEECDDGNVDKNDGCSSEGKLEWIKVCEAPDRNCIEVAVITPLAGNASDQSGQVIAGLFRPDATNPPADFDTAAQSFKIEIGDDSNAPPCTMEFNEAVVTQAMVRPFWALKCSGHIAINQKVRVTYKGTTAVAEWRYKDPLGGLVTVTSPERLLATYNIANSTITFDGDKPEQPTDAPEIGGKYSGDDIADHIMKMYFYKTTQDRYLHFVGKAENQGSPSVESEAAPDGGQGPRWNLKAREYLFKSTDLLYGPKESGVFFFQPYYKKPEGGGMLSSGIIALRDLMNPDLKDVTFEWESDRKVIVSGTIYDGGSEGASGERFANVNILVQNLDGKSITSTSTSTGFDGKILGTEGSPNIEINLSQPKPAKYKIVIRVTDRVGNKTERTITVDPKIKEAAVAGDTLTVSLVDVEPKSEVTLVIKDKNDSEVKREQKEVGASGALDAKVNIADLPVGTYEVVLGDVEKEFTIEPRIDKATVDGDSLAASGLASQTGQKVPFQITKGSEKVQDGMVTTKADGSWEANNIDISDLAPGEYKIVVDGAEKDFTVGPKLNEATVSDGTLNAQGDAVAGSTVIVEIKKDGQVVKSEPVTAHADGTWDANVALDGLAPGEYKIVVGGAEKDFTVGPKINDTTVSDGTLNAQGDAVAGSTVIVEIKKDGQVVRSEPVTARADGTWDANVALDGLAPGKYEVTVGGVTKEIVIPDDLTGTTAGGCSSTDSSGGLLALLLGVLGMIGITRRRN